MNSTQRTETISKDFKKRYTIGLGALIATTVIFLIFAIVFLVEANPSKERMLELIIIYGRETAQQLCDLSHAGGIVFIVMTIISAALTAFLWYALKSTIKKAYLTVYDKYIQGYAIIKIMPTEVTLEYNKITSVYLKKGMLCVKSNGGTFKFPVENSYEICTLLKEKCHC